MIRLPVWIVTLYVFLGMGMGFFIGLIVEQSFKGCP